MNDTRFGTVYWSCDFCLCTNLSRHSFQFSFFITFLQYPKLFLFFSISFENDDINRNEYYIFHFEILIRIITIWILSSSFNISEWSVCTLALWTQVRFDFYLFSISLCCFLCHDENRWQIIMFVVADFWFNFNLGSNLPR